VPYRTISRAGKQPDSSNREEGETGISHCSAGDMIRAGHQCDNANDMGWHINCLTYYHEIQ
jgi:hypothetical protein